VRFFDFNAKINTNVNTHVNRLMSTRNLRRAGERHFAAKRVAEKLLTESIGRAAHHLQDSLAQLRCLQKKAEEIPPPSQG
jgi:hypothetical protein